MARDHLIMKTRRIARRLLPVAARQFCEPVFNSSQVLTLAASVIGTFLILMTADSARAQQEMSEWLTAAQAFGVVLAGWAIISLLRAPFIVVKEDRAKGKWFGNRFVYHEPLLIGVFRCKPTGKIEMHKFKVLDVESRAYISYTIELDGGHNLAEIGLGGTIFTGPIPYRNWPGTGGVLLPKSKEVIFQIRLPTNARSVTARVYCRNFLVGEHNDQDGTTGNYQFPVRPPLGSEGVG